MPKSRRLRKDHKLQVWITSDVYEKLKRISKREGRSIAELVREFIAEGVARKEATAESST